ncbi:MAG TPA: host attachment protein [Chloroflexota bacterium]|nr:host attachment protein [Chloroflexota bacterium]
MVTEEDLKALARFNGNPHPVLSLYLSLDPLRQERRTSRLVFKDLVKMVQAGLDEDAQRALKHEVERVEGYLQTAPPQARGVAIFSCSPRDFWQAYPLPVHVAPDLHFEVMPYTRPLLEVLDEYERYAVALVDKKQARLFTVYLGEIEEDNQLANFVPSKPDEGHLSEADYQHHHQAHIYRHLKNVVWMLATLQRTHPFDRLVLAGPKEVTGELRQLLTKPLRAKMIGTIPSDIFVSKEQILQKTLEIERQLEREAEERLVKEVLGQEDGVLATCGVDATLQAIWMAEVQTLAVADELRLAGAECPNCGCLVADQLQSCPACGATLTPLDDLVQRAGERTIEDDGRVEIVHGSAATRLNESGGGMGALLRFDVGEQVLQEAP